jgi:uncharacterized protein YndB with AHSA1/START domain
MSSENVVSVERVIHAPPERIFELLADPSRHQEIDGSGTVRAAKEGSRRLALGDRFGMGMRMGLPYSMVSTVIEFEEGRRIAWQSFPPGPVGKVVGGRIWRYELEPVDGGTRVRESWDLSQDRQRGLLRRFMADKTRRNMERTLERIEEIVMSGAPAGGETAGEAAGEAG